MVILGGVTLNQNIVWADKYSWSPVVQSQKRTLGGKLITVSAGVQKGRPITLTSLADQGWFTVAEVDAVQVLADAVGAVYSLVIGAETFNVMFMHDSPPAFQATPLIQRAVPDPDDYFLATIRLITV